MGRQDMEERSSIDLQRFYPESLQIIKISEETEQIKITMKSNKHRHYCPKCGEESDIYHAVYIRTVQDMPIFGKPTILEIKSYDYYCANSDCEVNAFRTLPTAGSFKRLSTRFVRRRNAAEAGLTEM